MFSRVLIANRGEIAIRIARTALDLGMQPVAVHPADDAESLHVLLSEERALLPGSGGRAYLDIPALIAAARAARCDAVHPGYGFQSENADFARACAAAGLVFIGPSPVALEGFGDKARARSLAKAVDVPVIAGTDGAADLEGIKAFFAALPAGAAMMIKAIAGGGGRGVRIVREAGEIDAAFAACAREAQLSFGNGALYAERLIEKPRHIEVQVAGDGDQVIALGERDCTLQRRHQKILEIAPAPHLDAGMRRALHQAAVTLCRSVGYRTLGTVEFLLDMQSGDFAFIEANARLQVEHTVTEEVTGLDLVRCQFELAAGKRLADIGLVSTPSPRGFAIQARINTEKMAANGMWLPSSGLLAVYEPPSGPGVRVDGYGYAGYKTSPSFDSLLAKLIVRGSTFEEAASRTARALAQFRIEGVATNIPLLRVLSENADVRASRATTRFIEERSKALLDAMKALPSLDFGKAPAAQPAPAAAAASSPEVPATPAVLAAPAGAVAVNAPLRATVCALEVKPGDLVRAGRPVIILEAMKMEHVLNAPVSGRIALIPVQMGEVVATDQALVFIQPEDMAGEEAAENEAVDLDHIRPDLAEVEERWRITRDEARPEAVERRHKFGQRTARENIDDLLDPGSFIEYGAFVLANQRFRYSEEQLKKLSPADGMVCGIGNVNGSEFTGKAAAVCAVAYDYTVFAGTQATMNHTKLDRLLDVANEQKLPVVLYAEGGGGRPGESIGRVSKQHTWKSFARLSGEVPTIAIVSRYCFAGNATLAGMSSILIATKNSNIGMAGPAMIEGGGMGVVKPAEIGPLEVQSRNGVVDIVVEDEAEATRIARQALSYFQGSLPEWHCADQRLLRRSIPENRLRAFDVRSVIETLADSGSFLELRRAFAPGFITGFMRVEGRAVGLIANDSRHLGGAIDADGSDKGARFLQLCDAFDIPVLSLIDTPGFMVGVHSETQAAVRKTARLFIAGHNLGVPLFSVVLRKCYGLGAAAMLAGAKDEPVFSVAWPTGEFGSMGLEGAVMLAYRKEMDAEPDPVKRRAIFDEQVARLYAAGKAVEHAAMLRIDAVIDPADTRRWLLQGINACLTRREPRRRYVDTW